ncbi:MAG: GNAT family N-acetyltransferase [Terasakiella sp.]|uniref:GNAT family N-acetyltransferase n=1 Tax=unclassified Terasakiella TaxID=2614952 RepID=UPI003B00B57A
MISIRLFKTPDCEAMITLFQRSVHEIACQHYNPAQLAAWAPKEINQEDWLKRCLSRPTWLAWDDNTLAGFIDLEDNGHLNLLYVSPDYQGQGLAKSLYNTVEKQARLNKNKSIFVEASLSARPFFEKQGFHVQTRQTVERKGETFINFKMEKSL